MWKHGKASHHDWSCTRLGGNLSGSLMGGLCRESRHDGRSETIYLKDVDCPELKQPYGKQAKHATDAFVGNRDIVVRALTRDKRGRTSAEVLLPDGQNVGRELVKEGLAWWQRSSSGDGSLGDLEELARAAGKGLWSEPNPVPPWKWKVTKKTSRKYSN